MNDLKEAIARIGREMVACDKGCAGISCEQSKGILPRCLILETRSGKEGCAVVGINPGRARPAETSYYAREGATYDAVVRYWNEKITSHPYYQRLRKLTNSMGLNGPILWTELAKCESMPGAKLPPLKTLRTCTGQFLTRELEAIPLAWPLIGIGKEAYRALAYRYPARTVIGVPHPTGAYGDKFSCHLPSGRRHLESSAAVQKALSGPPGQLLWLGDVEGNEKSYEQPGTSVTE